MCVCVKNPSMACEYKTIHYNTTIDIVILIETRGYDMMI